VNIENLDLNLLVVFQALMTERSVTKAAARVNLSQPAVSNALARLRVHFGDRLFVRGRKVMVPTPRALDLAPKIDAGLEQFRGAIQPSRFDPRTSKATMRMASTDEIELRVLPPLVRRMETLAPGISMNFSRIHGLYSLPAADLESGSLDFAIGMFTQPLPFDTSLFFRELYTPRFVCIARKGHPHIRGRLTLKTFCTVGHVATFYPGHGPGLIDAVLAERGLKRNVRLSLPHWLSLPFAVAQSDLIATVPESIARAIGRSLRLQQLKCPVRLPRLPVSLVWHARTNDDEAHRWFREMIISVCRKTT
jgi:DNA-binding transcriptional LysR family regulator